MRIVFHPRGRIGYISIAFLFIIIPILIPYSTAVPGDQIFLEINKDLDGPWKIFEKDDFIVSVYDINYSGDSPYLRGVEINFNGETYQISEQSVSAEIYLKAPSVYTDSEYIIEISKEGYISNEYSISVIKRKLRISIEDSDITLNANDLFSVHVTEIDEYDIEQDVIGAFVTIESLNINPIVTNQEGIAVLTAPDNKEKIRVIASKDGYEDAEITVYIQLEKSFWQIIIENEYFIIIVAAICLISAIIFVNIRQRKSISNRAKEISDKKTIQRLRKKEEKSDLLNNKSNNNDVYKKDIVRSHSEKDPRVEEIRISRPNNEKEIIKVETDEDKTDKVVSEKRNKIKDYDWFEGTDDMRYEIDKLTGEVDEEGLDKWFEGVDDLKDKIKEKVKNKDKRKNEDKKE